MQGGVTEERDKRRRRRESVKKIRQLVCKAQKNIKEVAHRVEKCIVESSLGSSNSLAQPQRRPNIALQVQL